MDYNDSIRAVKGVGEKAEQRFAKLQIREVGDLLEHYPRDYDEFHDTVPIRTLEEGKRMAIEGVLRRKPTVRNTSRIKMRPAPCRSHGSTCRFWRAGYIWVRGICCAAGSDA